MSLKRKIIVTRSVSLMNKRHSAATAIQRLLVRDRDPITLQLIKKPFRLLRNGTMISYDAHSLLEYVGSTGDTNDPIARQPLQRHELMRLCRVTRSAALSPTSLAKKKGEEIQRRSALSFLQDELTNHILAAASILDIVQALVNLRMLANEFEFKAALQSLRSKGVEIKVRGLEVEIDLTESGLDNEGRYLMRAEALAAARPFPFDRLQRYLNRLRGGNT